MVSKSICASLSHVGIIWISTYRGIPLAVPVTMQANMRVVKICLHSGFDWVIPLKSQMVGLSQDYRCFGECNGFWKLGLMGLPFCSGGPCF